MPTSLGGWNEPSAWLLLWFPLLQVWSLSPLVASTLVTMATTAALALATARFVLWTGTRFRHTPAFEN